MHIEKIKSFTLGNKLILAVVGVGLVFLLINRIGSCVDKRQGATVEQISADAVRRHVIDSMQRIATTEQLKQKDELVKQSEQRLQEQQKVTTRYKREAQLLKHKTDSLMAVYEADPTLQNCDSVVDNQQKVIAEQDNTIESLGAEAEEYSGQLYVIKQKVTLLDSAVLRERNEVKALQISLADTRTMYEKLSERRKIGNAIRNAIIVTELVALIVMRGK